MITQMELLSKLKQNAGTDELIDMLAEQFEIVDILSRNYRNVYKINTEKGTMGIVKLDGYVLPALEGKQEILLNYKDIIDVYVKERVYHEDRKKVLKALSLEVVLENLAGKDEYSSSFRVVEKRKVHYCQFKIFKLEGNRNYDLIAGFQIIDDMIKEAREKEALIRKSTTDEMTGCLNRRAYEEAMLELTDKDQQANIIYIAMDVNGLKATNDTLGHAAGDELIAMASKCMKQCFSAYGDVYRTGGDEFAAIICTSENECSKIMDDFVKRLSSCEGVLVPGVSVSAGVIMRNDHPDASMFEISKLADRKMYEDKSRYYRRKGVDRRGQFEAQAALGRLYKVIAKGNIDADYFQIASSGNTGNSENENEPADSLTGWLSKPVRLSHIDPSDIAEYTRKTSLAYIGDSFASGSKKVSVYYGLRDGDVYRKTLLEIIPANDYSDTHRTIYIYLKDMDD